MKTVAPLLCTVALALLLALTGCKESGISTSADYRTGAKKFQVAKVKVIQIAKEARSSGDPKILSGAVERLVPAGKIMHAAAHGLQISDPEISACHQQLLSAVDGYKSFLDGIAPGVMNTPLPKSKIAMKAAIDTFNSAVDGWKATMDALP